MPDGTVKLDGVRQDRSDIITKDRIKLDTKLKLQESLSPVVEGKYDRKDQVGKGGMKMVVRVSDKDTARDIAMAYMLREGEGPETSHFVQEARITANLEHPNIVPVHDMGVDSSGKPFFTMKLLGGETLAEILDKLAKGDAEYRKKYNLYSLLQIFQKVCDGVAFAHSKGVIHLDLKPQNIQVGDFGEVLILDWGLSKMIGALETDPVKPDVSTVQKNAGSSSVEVTMDGTIKGTAGYMAPEQAEGRVKDKDCRTDIYALGATLYSMLTLKLPFEGDNFNKVVMQTVKGEIIPPHRRAPERFIPKSLDAVAMKAMATKADDRYQSVGELSKDINAFIGGFATRAERAGILKKSLLFARRNRKMVGISAVGLVILMLLLSYAGYEYYQQKGKWITVFSRDFTKKNVKLDDLLFANTQDEVKPWERTPQGLKMITKETMWLNKVFVKNEIMVIADVEFGENPDGFELFFNSKREILSPYFFVPRGYSFQSGGYSGLVDIISKNDVPQTTDVMKSQLRGIRASGIQRLVFKREAGRFTLSVNGRITASMTDLLPLVGNDLKSIGMRSYAFGTRLRYLEVRKLTLAPKVSPLVSGDSYLANGDYSGAVSTYVSIADDFQGKEIEKQALLKAYLAECMSKEPDDARLRDIKSRFEKICNNPELLAAICEVEALNSWKKGRYDEGLNIAEKALGLKRNSRVGMNILALRTKGLPGKIVDRLLSICARTEGVCSLSIPGMGLRSLEFLTGMRLLILDARDNGITNLEPLRGQKLVYLNLLGNQINDIAPLKGMTLKVLNLDMNRINDVEALKGMPLEVLSLRWNQISDISPLKDMKLRNLSIGDNQICDISPLKGMPLYNLIITGNRINNLEVLSGMKLTSLEACENNLTDISPLRGMPLQKFSCDGNRIESLEPLKDSPDLSNLQCPSNCISSLEPLRGLPLNWLDCSFNKVDSLEPVEDCLFGGLFCNDNKLTSLGKLVDKPPKIFVFNCDTLPDSVLESDAEKWSKTRPDIALQARTIIALRHNDIPTLKKLAIRYKNRLFLRIPVALEAGKAGEYCRTHGFRPAEVNDEETGKFLVDNRYTGFWLLVKQNPSGKYVWEISGNEVLNAKFLKGNKYVYYLDSAGSWANSPILFEKRHLVVEWPAKD